MANNKQKLIDIINLNEFKMNAVSVEHYPDLKTILSRIIVKYDGDKKLTGKYNYCNDKLTPKTHEVTLFYAKDISVLPNFTLFCESGQKMSFEFSPDNYHPSLRSIKGGYKEEKYVISIEKEE